MISLHTIKTTSPKPKRQTINVQDGSSLFLIIEPKGNNCKRFVGVTRFPRGRQGKKKEISLGIFGKDINTKTDIEQILRTWDSLKQWCKETGESPDKFFAKDEYQPSEVSLKDVFFKWFEFYKKTVKETTWSDRKNKLNQMLKFFGEDLPISEMEWRNGGRKRVLGMMEVMENRGSHNHAGRCRSVLKDIFEYAIDQDLMEEGQNPASKKPNTECIGYTPESNPTIDWKDVPELFNSLKTNSPNSSKLTQLAVKFYLMSCIRVGAIVRLEWDWFDESENLWIIPASTSGLKNKLKNSGKDYDHLIPVTQEMRQVMDELRTFTGFQEYVFYSPEGKKYPHLNPETINTFLSRLGYKNILTGHGWRRVVVTAGQEIGGFNREIIERQIGQRGHKQGAIGVYDRTQFLDQRREFMNWWTKELVNQGMEI